VANVSFDRVRVLTAAMSLLFLGYAGARAARVPLTYDEAASYIRYVDTSVPSTPEINVLSLFSFEVATNHFVNTVLTKIAWAVGGGGEVWLRLPNLAADAAFMAFALLILRPRVDPWIAVAGFALLNLNLYAAEFFALSRGYGVSLACLMGALLYLLRFLDEGRAGDASRALALALVAVMANFALLNAYTGIFAVIFVAGVALKYGRDVAPRVVPALLLPAAAAAFALLVLSQDIWLSDALYKPVAVTLVGIGEQDLDRVRVVEVDLHGRERRWSRVVEISAGINAAGAQDDLDGRERRPSRDAWPGRWHSNPGAHLRGLRVELPSAVAPQLARLELVIGSRVFPGDAQLTGWIGSDEGGMRVLTAGPSLSLPKSRVPLFRSLLNWSGDADYALIVATNAAYVLAAIGALAALLKIAGRLLVRAGIAGAGVWRALESGALWTAALAGPPVYLLKTHSELYFGGIAGLVTDSYLSLINRSFHGRTYAHDQTQIAFALILLTVAAFAMVSIVNWRRGAVRRVLPGLCVLAVIAIASLMEIAQHVIFDTLYLMDRTALFYIPLCVLFVIFACQAIAESSPIGRMLARTVVVTAAALAALHFVAAADTKRAIEWPTDESTRAMMADLREVTRQRPAGSRVLLGVEPIYAPVAVYYARTTPGVEVLIVPPAMPGAEFFYGTEPQSPSPMKTIRRYPATETVLTTVGR
jgi:hypothetical protein